jgi:hypothetical protein
MRVSQRVPSALSNAVSLMPSGPSTIAFAIIFRSSQKLSQGAPACSHCACSSMSLLVGYVWVHADVGRGHLHADTASCAACILDHDAQLSPCHHHHAEGVHAPTVYLSSPFGFILLLLMRAAVVLWLAQVIPLEKEEPQIHHVNSVHHALQTSCEQACYCP